jgi:hypothetical protein
MTTQTTSRPTSTEPCFRCGPGNGTYYWGAVINGVPQYSGQCFRCHGTGIDPEPVRRTPTHIDVQDGIFTVVLDSGAYRTIRLCHGDDDASEVQFVSFLSGSDNESSYTCCGFIKQNVYRWTRKYADQHSAATPLSQCVRFLITATPERRHEFGVAYAKASGRCYVCNRTLTTPESIEAGIGPVCAGRQ